MFPFSDKVYKWLKWIATVFGPAFTALVGVVLTALNLDAAGITVTILAGVVTFIGALVMKSSTDFNKTHVIEVTNLADIPDSKAEGTD